MNDKLLKFITCGSVDDGKSTLIGHLLYDAKLIFADQKRALELDSKVGSITRLVRSDSTEASVSSMISSRVTAFDSTAPERG